MSIKTFSQVVSAMLSRISSAQPTVDTKAGTFVRDVAVEPVANEIGSLYSEVHAASLAQSVDTGVGADVVRLAENYGLRRKTATKATGTVTFYRSGAPSADVSIPIGTDIATVAMGRTPAQHFVTTTAATLPSTGADAYYNADTGRYEVTANVQAVEGGVAGSVAAGSVVVVTLSVDGIQGCTNAAALTGGTDQETIEALRIRVRDVLSGNATVTRSGILTRVGAVAGVEDSELVEYSNIPGTVAVYVKGSSLVGTSEMFGYTAAQVSYTLLSQPVSETAGVTIVGSSSETLTEGTHFSMSYDSGFYGGSTLGRTKVVWLTTLPEQTMTVTYGYNALVSALQESVDATSARALGQSVVVKQATAVPVDVGVRILLVVGSSFTSVQAAVVTALTSALGRYSMGETVQQSDIASAVTAVAGVDAVKLPLTTFTAGTITQNAFGDLDIPGGSYASVGTITVTQ